MDVASCCMGMNQTDSERTTEEMDEYILDLNYFSTLVPRQGMQMRTRGLLSTSSPCSVLEENASWRTVLAKELSPYKSTGVEIVSLCKSS